MSLIFKFLIFNYHPILKFVFLKYFWVYVILSFLSLYSPFTLSATLLTPVTTGMPLNACVNPLRTPSPFGEQSTCQRPFTNGPVKKVATPMLTKLQAMVIQNLCGNRVNGFGIFPFWAKSLSQEKALRLTAPLVNPIITAPESSRDGRFGNGGGGLRFICKKFS